MSISMSQQKIEQFSGGGTTITLPGIKLTGTTPLTQVSTGTTLQGLADKLGKGNTWQAIAEANNIENPRILTPGTLINFNVK
jgi:nucleoid-associated protein YgaU